MKPISSTVLVIVLCLFFSTTIVHAQTFGTKASAVWITDCNQSNYFNTSGAGVNAIGPAANVFTNKNFGAHTQNSGTLILRGGEVRTFKTPDVSNVCNVVMHYRVYPQGGTPGVFDIIDLSFLDECHVPSSQFFSGGPCVNGDQKWNHIIPDGATVPYTPVDLTSFAPGNYVLEIYYVAAGSATTTTECDETVVLNNGGNNYKAFFSIQAPVLVGTNPTTCNGTQGSISINGLVPATTYTITYSDDGTTVGPANILTNGSGQAIITGLNAGVYGDFEIFINGCTTSLNTELILANGAPVAATLSSNNPTTCNGTEGSISINGLVPGTSYSITYSDDGIILSPVTIVANGSGQAIISGLNAGVYSDFEIFINGCTTELNTGLILSNPVFTPTFNSIAAFCAGTTAPTLATTSNNGISGTWNPALIDNQASGSYVFTPTPGTCGLPVTKNVTVNPKLTPTFSFGTTLTVCAGGTVPTLPSTSTNSITGTWSPSTVDNQASGVYTFTPTAGQCAVSTTFTVTVTPNVTPTFSFGTTLTICAGGTVPSLPTTSTNSITGSWSSSTVDNQNSGVYTFTPTAGVCALPVTFTVTVNPNITPTFSFGTTLTVCAGGTVPILLTTSTNSITGTWSPSTVDNQNSAVYTFTPTAGLCALPTTFTVTVSPNITPTFSFGTTLTVCAGGTVPTLPTISTDNITGIWSPSTVDNQASGVYTFTPTAGQCAVPTTFTVTVTPNVTPTFSFGTTLTICAGGTVPTLPTTSDNAISGTWSPSTADNQASGVYTFTPTSGVCALPVTFTVTVNPNITPAFSFGTTLTVCPGGTVPTLPTTSTNSITGTWSPSTVDNQNSAVYTFTPTAGLCALPTTFTVTVSPNITPTFGFGTTLTVCAGGTVPVLSTTSTDNITGTWSPSTVDNQASGVYAFTPTAGQCALPTTFSVTVTPNVTPTFSFGTTLTICAGGTVPTLPTTSDNAISGTWTPSTVDNQASGVYTFTPTAGQCAVATTFTVTVTPNVTSTFSFGTTLTICAGGIVPTLPTTSDNSISGTWSPSTVDNQASGVYTFTPTAGVCALPITFTVTVTPNVIPTFSFGTSLTVCAGGTVPTLPTTSDNAISGTWSPSTVDNQASDVYTFTPAAGPCALPTTFTVTVSPNITPTFSFGTTLTICAGATVPVLSTTSTDNITGTWSPSTVDNQASGVYTFTPTAGQCAVSTTFTVTVTPNITPTFSFGTTLTICAGGTVPTLPTASDNAISGTWSPSTVDNQASSVYTFTPTAGVCALPTTFTVTVNPNVTPTFSFGTTLTICAGGTVPTLPATSANSITGTWSPSTVDNQASGVYTFTPTAGLCALPTTFTVTVSPNITPTFSFGTTLTVCAGGTVPTLPTTSTDNITGTWSPSTVDNQASGVYTFTPTAGQCALPTTFTVTVTPNVTPTFGFGTTLIICAGGTVPALSTTSDNAISGTWSPSTVDNQASGVYTFTPTAGVCALPATFTVTVNPNITPTFSFGTAVTICNAATPPTLPATSTNNITGTWSPSTIDNQNSAVYTFTPTAGLCAVPTTFTVTVSPNITPTFSFGSSLTVCSGATVPSLPTTSTNSITGTWSPSTVDNQASGVYTFTPTAGLCALPTTFTVTVTPTITPTFDFGTQLIICTNGTVPVLNNTSTNGIAGTWNPAVVSNQSSGVYSFTPTATPDQCIAPATFTVTVNPILTPTFSFGTSLIICAGNTVPALPTTSVNGIIGTWSPAVVSNQASGVYTFATTPGQCATATATFTVTVNPVGTVNSMPDITVDDGAIIPSNSLTGTPGGVSLGWSNSNTGIGLTASGTGNVPSFTAINRTDKPVSATITVTPNMNSCAGTAKTYIITIKPLAKDVFVPNVFSPNGDGKNDVLLVYGNYIEKLDMRIFNQWGQQVATVNSPSKGWNGTQGGKAQPVGVYVYELQAVLSDGRSVKLKGYITLLR